MTSGSYWAASNPTVAGDNPTFPFDRGAAEVLGVVPEGLVASPAVLHQFLDPPDARGDWFSSEAWEQASLLLRNDPAITWDEYQDLIARFNRIQDALMRWTEVRPDMTKGYAEQVSDSMRRAGGNVWTEIRNLSRGPLAKLSAKAGVADNTKQALTNYGEVLWEYVQCTAFELEASHDQSEVAGIHDRFASEATDPWEPGVTPDNVESGGITIGARRLPPLPSSPDGTSTTGEKTGTGETGNTSTTEGTSSTGGDIPGTTGKTDIPGTGTTDIPGTTGKTDITGTGTTDIPGTGTTEIPGTTGKTDVPGSGTGVEVPGTGTGEGTTGEGGGKKE